MIVDMVEMPPRKTTAREVTEALIEGSAGMVPVVGNPLAVAFAVALGWSYSRRMNSWLEELAIAVTELQEKSGVCDYDELAENEAFVDAVVAATRASQATHDAAKLAALRNGVLNTLTPEAPAVDEQARFFRLVEQFTPSHLRLLRFLDDPGEFFDSLGIERPNLYMGGRSGLLEALPEFAGRRDWYDLLNADLAAAALTNHGGLHVTQTGASLWQPATSVLGKRFLAFIRDPRAASSPE